MICQSCLDSREVFTAESNGWKVPPCQKCGGQMGSNRPKRYATLHGGFKAGTLAERLYKQDMKSRGYEPVGDEPAENIEKMAAENKVEAKARRRRDIAKRVGQFVNELGSDTAANLAALEMNNMLPTMDDAEAECQLP